MEQMGANCLQMRGLEGIHESVIEARGAQWQAKI
jgi:hypothetical protein